MHDSLIWKNETQKWNANGHHRFCVPRVSRNLRRHPEPPGTKPPDPLNLPGTRRTGSHTGTRTGTSQKLHWPLSGLRPLS